MEIWKTHPEIDDRYEISNLGRLQRKDTNMILKLSNDMNNGLFTILKPKNSMVRKKYKIHRLVGQLFVPNPDTKNKTIVKHLDGDRKNNMATNLEWITYQESIDIDMARGKSTQNNKISEIDIIKIRNDFNDFTTNIYDLATKYGFCVPTLKSILTYKTYKEVQPEKEFEYIVNSMLDNKEYYKKKFIKPRYKQIKVKEPKKPNLMDRVMFDEIASKYVNSSEAINLIIKNYSTTKYCFEQSVLSYGLPKIKILSGEIFYKYNSYYISNFGRVSNGNIIIGKTFSKDVAFTIGKLILGNNKPKKHHNDSLRFIDGNFNNLHINNLEWIYFVVAEELPDSIKNEIINEYKTTKATYNDLTNKYALSISRIIKVLKHVKKIKICDTCGEKNQESFLIYTRPKKCDKCIEQAKYKNLSDEEKKAKIEYAKKWVVNNPIRTKILAAKNRAKIKGLDFDIDEKFVTELFLNQNKRCKYSGLEISLTNESKNIFSIDRIDSTLGYTKDNVCLTLEKINTMKMDLSLKEFLFYVKAIHDNNDFF